MVEQARHERSRNDGFIHLSMHTGYPQPAHSLTARTVSLFTRSNELWVRPYCNSSYEFHHPDTVMCC